MSIAEKNGGYIKIYRIFYEVIKELPREDGTALFMALAAYYFDGELPAFDGLLKRLWESVTDEPKRKSKAGGGRTYFSFLRESYLILLELPAADRWPLIMAAMEGGLDRKNPDFSGEPNAGLLRAVWLADFKQRIALSWGQYDRNKAGAPEPQPNVNPT